LTVPGFAAAVLAGGASRRLGTDKALAEVAGMPLAALVRRAVVTAGAAPVVAVGGDRDGLEALGFRWIADRWPGAGPLGGTLTALDALEAEVVAVCACDLPWIRSDVVRALATTAAATGAVALPVVGGHRQPLLAAYPRAARTGLRAAFDAGERSMRAGLDAVEVVEVPVAAVDAAGFDDVDTPEDLARARRRHPPQ
jgi:molybdopterin-guanine dinucleotide biosynthesis protein A